MSEPVSPQPEVATPGTSMVLADFGPRALAIIIDAVIVMIVNAILGLIPVVGWLLALVVPFAYYIYFFAYDNPVGMKGQTPGKKLMNIRVVTEEGGDLDMTKALIRVIGYIVSSIILFIGFLFPLWREDKKALHDIIAGTRVIKV